MHRSRSLLVRVCRAALVRARRPLAGLAGDEGEDLTDASQGVCFMWVMWGPALGALGQMQPCPRSPQRVGRQERPPGPWAPPSSRHTVASDWNRHSRLAQPCPRPQTSAGGCEDLV